MKKLIVPVLLLLNIAACKEDKPKDNGTPNENPGELTESTPVKGANQNQITRSLVENSASSSHAMSVLPIPVGA